MRGSSRNVPKRSAAHLHLCAARRQAAEHPGQQRRGGAVPAGAAGPHRGRELLHHRAAKGLHGTLHGSQPVRAGVASNTHCTTASPTGVKAAGPPATHASEVGLLHRSPICERRSAPQVQACSDGHTYSVLVYDKAGAATSELLFNSATNCYGANTVGVRPLCDCMS